MTEQKAEKKLGFCCCQARNQVKPVTAISGVTLQRANVMGASQVSDTGLTEDACFIVKGRCVELASIQLCHITPVTQFSTNSGWLSSQRTQIFTKVQCWVKSYHSTGLS